ncbi:putative transcriptional regulator [Candidatus Desulfosporosinus infrequens]|uniref:Putative transcriptional regulator n=1 Tax=Candidatus Desulfosporosinus infrequens TaxID=2043169 RepID=A0A2U3LBL3_9FIRM|nr:putative transcriptional regulator [Candidatus Desulfosporosinus infrequens]
MTTLSNLMQSLEWYKRLEVLRITSGWSQSEAANECGTNQKVYWLWEKGLSYPRNNSRIAIAKAFKVPVYEIFGRQFDKEAATRL